MCTWVPIPGFENYSVSNHGDVRNIVTGKNKVLKKDTKGYYCVDLYSNSVGTRFRVHRLVASAFIDNPYNKGQVNHIDGDKTNNDVSNLEWATQSENMKHAHRIGLCHTPKTFTMKGRKNPNACRSRWVGVLVVETGEFYNSLSECERATGASHISEIIDNPRKTSNGLHFIRAEKV